MCHPIPIGPGIAQAFADVGAETIKNKGDLTIWIAKIG
jgi:hypothetical protein